MARLAKLPIPEAVVANSQPALLQAISLNPSSTLEARLAAAERAESLGIIDTAILRDLYGTVTFTPEELAAPLADKSARGRALLYRAAVQQPSPTAKAEIIGKALSLAGDNFGTLARVFAPEIAGLKPQPELTSFIYPAARALFAAGRPDLAKLWIGFARGQGLINTEMASASASLWPLVRLTAGDNDKPIPTGVLAAWRKARGDTSTDAAQRRNAVCYSLLAAFGEKVPAEDWLPLLDGPPLVSIIEPRPALWHGLRSASEDLRLGETVMMALATLGEPGLTQADPSEIYRVVSALRLVGLDADAHSLAVEAAIANGV
jgi:hypothetical protein